MATDTYFYGLGRRKSASASVRLLPGKGTITINGKAAAEYLDGNKTLLAEVTDPLAIVSKQKKYDVTILVNRWRHFAVPAVGLSGNPGFP